METPNRPYPDIQIRPNGTSARLRSSSAPPAGPGAPWPDWPTSRSSAPTCPPPPNGVSTPSTPSPGSSRTGPGSRRPPHHPDQHAGRDRGRHPRHQRPHNRTTRHPRLHWHARNHQHQRPLQLRLNSYKPSCKPGRTHSPRHIRHTGPSACARPMHPYTDHSGASGPSP